MSIETVRKLSDSLFDDLQRLYGSYISWQDRGPEEIRSAIEHSDEVVGFCEAGNGTLIACARILTDYVYYATVYDVVVSETRRRGGLGTRLIEEVVDHPPIESVDLYLGSRDGLVPFYENCGFEMRAMTIELEDRDEDLHSMMYRRR
jgi:predicted GNAT family N-acyltransferase